MKATLLLALSLQACHSTGPYPNDPQEKTYRADRDAVYHAMVRALAREGFSINVADPIRLRIEAKAGDRVAILQGIDKGGAIVIRIGMVRAEARDFRRLWRRLDQEVEG